MLIYINSFALYVCISMDDVKHALTIQRSALYLTPTHAHANCEWQKNFYTAWNFLPYRFRAVSSRQLLQ